MIIFRLGLPLIKFLICRIDFIFRFKLFGTRNKSCTYYCSFAKLLAIAGGLFFIGKPAFAFILQTIYFGWGPNKENGFEILF